MNITDFINKCIDSGYEWSEGAYEGKAGYFIGSKQLDTTAHFSPEAIEKNDYSFLEKQITQGKNVEHITRIVGYYSRIENWNKSKFGELKDRHKGDYKIWSCCPKEGIGGGVRLKINIKKFNITDIIRLFQKKIELSECMFHKNECPNRLVCVIRKRIKKIEEKLLVEFNSITIEKLLKDAGGINGNVL